jgi:hypothetical protein
MEEKKEEGTCAKGGCGARCGCCACKAIKALVLLLVGSAIGFVIGRCCGHRGMCPTAVPAVSAPPAAPAPAPAAPQKKAN